MSNPLEAKWREEYANREETIDGGTTTARFALTEKERFEVEQIIREQLGIENAFVKKANGEWGPATYADILVGTNYGRVIERRTP
jgi:hypothetical protein